MKGGLLIREARLRSGLTQALLARRLGTSQSVVARWEAGGRSPSLETVTRVIHACGLDLHFSLVAGDEQEDGLIAQQLHLSPRQRLESNRAMLRFERRARRARRVGSP